MPITSATGGIITNYTSSGTNYRSHAFTASGQLQITGSATVELLLVGGGGGGSLGGGGESDITNRGNGGGGGGVVYSGSYSLTAGAWDVVVGAGGAGGSVTSAATNGGTSIFQKVGTPASASISSSFANGAFFQLTGSATGSFYVTSSTTQVDAPPKYYIVSGTIADIAAKINTLTSVFNIIAASSASILQLSASFNGTAGNSFKYQSASIALTLGGGVATISASAAYGGFGGQPQGGIGASGGGSYPTGAASINIAQGFAGGTQSGKSGAGGGGALNTGSNSTSVFNNPFTLYIGGAGGPATSSALFNGTASFYGGGGGGGGWVNVGPGGGGNGGSGVGGNGGAGSQGAGANGVANSGSGGGGGALSDQSSNWGAGGNGSAGIVIVRYTV